MDLIHGCFRQYQYWHLKDLKAKLKQPEAYLKQTLEIIAQLVRQGPYSMTWQLKPEYRKATMEEALNTRAPDMVDAASDIGEGGASDDDENVKMEDAT